MDRFTGSNKWFNKAQTHFVKCDSYSNGNIDNVTVPYSNYKR